MFGYPFWDALKGQVQDRVEILTSVDGVTFISQGFLQTSLWRKDIPVNYMLQDDETATGWNFEQTFMAPVQARYVRYHITPKRSMCVSELQVFDRIDYQPFDLRIALPETAEPPPPENVPPSVAVTSPSGDAQYLAPASVVMTADAQDADGTVTRVEFLAGFDDCRGRRLEPIHHHLVERACRDVCVEGTRHGQFRRDDNIGRRRDNSRAGCA